MTPQRLAAFAAVRVFRLKPDSSHGPGHWLRVMRNGREIADRTPGADRLVVDLFALLHDCQRQSDGPDPEHGARAALFAEGLVQRGMLRLDRDRLRVLMGACEAHDRGMVTRDPTIGACWDADRFDLHRIGVWPHVDFMSTAAAMLPEVQSATAIRGLTRVWDRELARETALATDPAVSSWASPA